MGGWVCPPCPVARAGERAPRPTLSLPFSLHNSPAPTPGRRRRCCGTATAPAAAGRARHRCRRRPHRRRCARPAPPRPQRTGRSAGAPRPSPPPTGSPPRRPGPGGGNRSNAGRGERVRERRVRERERERGKRQRGAPISKQARARRCFFFSLSRSLSLPLHSTHLVVLGAKGGRRHAARVDGDDATAVGRVAGEGGHVGARGGGGWGERETGGGGASVGPIERLSHHPPARARPPSKHAPSRPDSWRASRVAVRLPEKGVERCMVNGRWPPRTRGARQLSFPRFEDVKSRGRAARAGERERGQRRPSHPLSLLFYRARVCVGARHAPGPTQPQPHAGGCLCAGPPSPPAFPGGRRVWPARAYAPPLFFPSENPPPLPGRQVKNNGRPGPGRRPDRQLPVEADPDR